MSNKQISQPLLKKQSSSNLNQPMNQLGDKTNTYHQPDEKMKYTYLINIVNIIWGGSYGREAKLSS